MRSMETEILDLKRKLRVYEENEKLQMVTEKDSLFSYLAGRDENYDILEK